MTAPAESATDCAALLTDARVAATAISASIFACSDYVDLFISFLLFLTIDFEFDIKTDLDESQFIIILISFTTMMFNISKRLQDYIIG